MDAMCKQIMGRRDDSVVCHADSWMCDGYETCRIICLPDTRVYETCKIICLLDTRVSNPTRCVSTLETAVKEPVVMVHLCISDTRICRKEVWKDKCRLLARKPKAKASTIVFSSTLLAPCLYLDRKNHSQMKEKVEQRRCELC